MRVPCCRFALAKQNRASRQQDASQLKPPSSSCPRVMTDLWARPFGEEPSVAIRSAVASTIAAFADGLLPTPPLNVNERTEMKRVDQARVTLTIPADPS